MPTNESVAPAASSEADASHGERYYELMAAAWMWDIGSREAIREALCECGLDPSDYDVNDDGACISALRTVAARRLLTPLHLSEPLRTRVAVTAGYLVLDHIRHREQLATLLRGQLMPSDASPGPGETGAWRRVGLSRAHRPDTTETTHGMPPSPPASPRRSRLTAPIVAALLCLVALVPSIGTAARLFVRGWEGNPEPEADVWTLWWPVAIGIGTALAGLGVFVSAWLAPRESRSRLEVTDSA